MPDSPSSLPPGHPLVDGRTGDAPLIRAYRGIRDARPPVWFMRQAGRSLPEYRESRASGAMLDACLTPELAAEITLQPVRRHRVDAGIFFSDIVVPLRLAGVDVEIVPGRGPVFARPVRDLADLADLVSHELPDAALAPIEQAVALVVRELGSTPLIGFAGAPFTLASYLVEGGPSKDQLRARTMMHADPEAWQRLVDWLADVSASFLRAQVRAGASAVQLFDSWAGALSERDYRASALPASARVLAGLAAGVPRVHFGTGTGELLPAMRDAGADVVGVDHRTDLSVGSRRLGGAVPVQGNVDPALLGAPWQVLERHLEHVVDSGRSAPAHVLNLGHGVPPGTDPDVLTRIVAWTHERSARPMTAPRAEGAAFVGVDLAWGPRNRTGLAAVAEDGRLLDSTSVKTDDEIADWVAGHRVAVAAIDAPLIVVNDTGRREAERQVADAWGRYDAGPHPTNRSRPWFRPPRGQVLAERLGWELDPAHAGTPERPAAIEVYPHPAMVGLFRLDRVLKYKKGSITMRRTAFARLLVLLEGVGPLRLAESAAWAGVRRAFDAAVSQSRLDVLEDEVDAVLCAHLAWLWRTDRGSLHVYGDLATGYIVAPPPRSRG